MSLRRVLADILPTRARPETPTTTLYFAGPLAEELSRAGRGGPIEVVEPNVFRAGRQLVIVRHWSAATQRLLDQASDLEVTYVIDDNLWVLDQDNHLPAAYLRRLQALKSAFSTHLEPRLVRVVSPSRQVLARFPHLETHLLDPALIYPLATLDHQEDAEGTLNIVYAGTASHLSDLSSISGALAELIGGNPAFTLTTFLGRRAPRVLRVPNATHHPPEAWARYQQTLCSLRFHIGLAPLLPTAFNQARSAARLLEYAALGAVGVYSDGLPYSRAVVSGQNGLLVSGGAHNWVSAILKLKDEPALRRRLAEGGQQTAARLGAPGKVRDFWRALLAISD